MRSQAELGNELRRHTESACDSETSTRSAETYARHKAELVKQNEGRFVLISGPRVVSVWDTYEDCSNQGRSCRNLPLIGAREFRIVNANTVEETGRPA